MAVKKVKTVKKEVEVVKNSLMMTDLIVMVGLVVIEEEEEEEIINQSLLLLFLLEILILIHNMKIWKIYVETVNTTNVK